MAEAIARVGEDDLAFINEMKKEPSSSCIEEISPTKVLFFNRNRRRNSSFAEFFEGDLSQNLLSRRHFSSRGSVDPGTTVSAIVRQIKDEDPTNMGLMMKVKKDENIKNKISEVLLPSNWFFRKSKKEVLRFEELLSQDRSRHTVLEPKENVEDDEEKEPRKLSLSHLISRHFSATKDIRAFNINMPQSQ
eukprot:GFUD01037680.1.p1 GENE.GFUD01037680.1~~GFUD01037680.1.p1  ORF type:complete len:190 (+),score=58.76 GFUD01037680.1:37-606(+)